jgi:hypothetical protein
MKGQWKGVRSMKATALVTIKVEPGTANPPLPTIKKHYDIFVVVYKLLDTVHTDQTGVFPITSQQGYQYIMVGIHLDANYIFCNLMKNQTKSEMNLAYQRMVNKMKLLALKLRAKDVTYGLITCLIRPKKTKEPNRTRLVAGGDRVHYPFNAGTPTANLLTIELLINSVISTPGARLFFTMDIKNFYPCTPMTRYEYMQLKLSDMLEDVTAHYHLLNIATPDRYVYCKIRQGM